MILHIKNQYILPNDFFKRIAMISQAFSLLLIHTQPFFLKTLAYLEEPQSSLFIISFPILSL